mmetsp:Transcript_39232/g.76617  ORF Transcript_39232/g.76617 Transcript_39232/m.76617 type:complete len:232 (-) Transcript_39232:387-1082(-)
MGGAVRRPHLSGGAEPAVSVWGRQPVLRPGRPRWDSDGAAGCGGRPAGRRYWLAPPVLPGSRARQFGGHGLPSAGGYPAVHAVRVAGAGGGANVPGWSRHRIRRPPRSPVVRTCRVTARAASSCRSGTPYAVVHGRSVSVGVSIGIVPDGRFIFSAAGAGPVPCLCATIVTRMCLVVVRTCRFGIVVRAIGAALPQRFGHHFARKNGLRLSHGGMHRTVSFGSRLPRVPLR